MNAEAIREGDIVEIDYIEEFTKEHINEGKALVIWKGNNNQPLVRKLSTKKTIWTCYEHIARVVGHIDIEDYMDRALSAEPCDDCISRQVVLDKLNRLIEVERLQGTDEMGYGRERVSAYESMIFEINSEYLYPSVTPKEKTGRWISFGIQGEIDGQIVRAFTCSKCGAISIFRVSNGNIVNGDLCPNCGAKMVEPQESEDKYGRL